MIINEFVPVPSERHLIGRKPPPCSDADRENLESAAAGDVDGSSFVYLKKTVVYSRKVGKSFETSRNIDSRKLRASFLPGRYACWKLHC